MNNSEIDDFLSNIDMRSGAKSCWLWKPGPDATGYGAWKGMGAHRVIYTLKNGTIPKDRVVMHTCDNPICCNPSHLKLGTHTDNRMDCVAKKRHAQGQEHGHSKLTHRQVRFIRTHHIGWTHREIAAKYGVSRSVITKIKSGDTYKGVGSKEPRVTS